MSAKKCLAALTTAFLLISSPAAFAVVVLQPFGVSVDPLMGSIGGHPASAMIGQTGLTGGSHYVSGVTEYNEYVDPTSGPKPIHTAAEADGNSWRNDLALTGFVEFDLGGTFVLTNVALWSGAGDTRFGSLKEFDVLVDMTPAGSFVAANQFNPVEVQNFVLDGPFEGSSVRFNVVSNYGDGVSIAEVAFGVTPVTIGEPFTVALLGIGLLGFGIRKRPPT